eukprot:2473894-Prymnesium_polylepis.1
MGRTPLDQPAARRYSHRVGSRPTKIAGRTRPHVRCVPSPRVRTVRRDKSMPTHRPTQPWTWHSQPAARWTPLPAQPAATAAMTSLTSALLAHSDITVTVDCFLFPHDKNAFRTDWTTT